MMSINMKTVSVALMARPAGGSVIRCVEIMVAEPNLEGSATEKLVLRVAGGSVLRFGFQCCPGIRVLRA